MIADTQSEYSSEDHSIVPPLHTKTMENHTKCQKDLESCFNTVMEFITQAGQIVIEGCMANKNVEIKANKSWDLVTQYDKRVEKTLIRQISEAYPTHKFIGEETSRKGEQLTDLPTWIIDPIDGTTNFVHNNPHCCISVALSVNKQIILGIVYNPILNQLFTAKKGCGAYLNGRPISVSKVQGQLNKRYSA